ncbi:hypothetical protein [Nostoc sp.]|uniref:hypothetical protein n=1 Tax=Nostoc sp. TaxID=1180 RepID=UPI002FF44185
MSLNNYYPLHRNDEAKQNTVGIYLQNQVALLPNLKLLFGIAGQILPGWNVIASFAHNDAFVSKDNSIPVGDRLGG